MEQEDIEFVRGQASHNRPDIQRLISLLVKYAGQAAYWHHFAYAHLTDNPICFQDHTFEEFEAKIKM